MSASETDRAFTIQDGDHSRGLVVLCDHASAEMPAEYGHLGLGAADLGRHIAYDIGAEAVSRRLGAALSCPVVLSRFSRLLIDPNRGLDDPTLVMRIADGAIVPGNARIDAAEIERRIARFYQPYDEAVGKVIARAAEANGGVAVVISVHSFTPLWRGKRRPWEIGILWDSDPRLAVPAIAALKAGGDLHVGDNEPYDGALRGDTLDRHAGVNGYPNFLIELRQDLIADRAAAEGWAERLAALIAPLLVAPELKRPIFYPSRARTESRFQSATKG